MNPVRSPWHPSGVGTPQVWHPSGVQVVHHLWGAPQALRCVTVDAGIVLQPLLGYHVHLGGQAVPPAVDRIPADLELGFSSRRNAWSNGSYVWCQSGDGGFREVPGLDLAGKFNLNLENLRVRHLSRF